MKVYLLIKNAPWGTDTEVFHSESAAKDAGEKWLFETLDRKGFVEKVAKEISKGDYSNSDEYLDKFFVDVLLREVQ